MKWGRNLLTWGRGCGMIRAAWEQWGTPTAAESRNRIKTPLASMLGKGSRDEKQEDEAERRRKAGEAERRRRIGAPETRGRNFGVARHEVARRVEGGRRDVQAFDRDGGPRRGGETARSMDGPLSDEAECRRGRQGSEEGPARRPRDRGGRRRGARTGSADRCRPRGCPARSGMGEVFTPPRRGRRFDGADGRIPVERVSGMDEAQPADDARPGRRDPRDRGGFSRRDQGEAFRENAQRIPRLARAHLERTG